MGQAGQTREIGSGVSVEVTRNSDGSYEVTVSGGKWRNFQGGAIRFMGVRTDMIPVAC